MSESKEDWLKAFDQLERDGIVIAEKRLNYQSPEIVIGSWCIGAEHQRSFRSIVLRWKGPGPLPSPPLGAFTTPQSDQGKDWPYRAKLVPNQLHDFVKSSLGLSAGPPVNVAAADYSVAEIDRAIDENRLIFPDVETHVSVALDRQRRGQDRIRVRTLAIYGLHCALCDVSDPTLLRASHIKCWAECEESRGLLSNVICLCVFHDALFENGFWSLDDQLGIVLRKKVGSETISKLLPVGCTFRKPSAHCPKVEFVRHHRNKHGLAC